jgi:arabinogalactan oligomer / maltooligosaccharide transport system permease protein
VAQKQAAGAQVIAPQRLPNRYWSALVHSRTAYLFLLPTVILVAILVVWPLIQGILFAFTDANRANLGNRYIGERYIAPSYKFTGLDNFSTILSDADFWTTLRQTIISWILPNVLLHFGLGIALAVVLNRNFRGRSIYRVLLMVPWAMPSYISALAWAWIFDQNTGIINNTLRNMGFQAIPWSTDAFWATVAVVTVNVWLGVPFYIITMLGGMQSIPTDLYEASSIDGASKWQNFWQITLPMLRPIVLTSTLLDVIWTFNNFNVIYLVTGGAPGGQTDILVTKSFILFQQGRFGASAAYSVVMLLLLLIFSIGYTRMLRENTMS